MSLSVLQHEYLMNATHRWNFKCGATGSGKTWIDFTVVIPQRLLAMRGEGDAVFFGHTQQSLVRNVVSKLQDVWGSDLVSNLRHDNSILAFGRRVYCLGADKVTAVNRIRGMTIEYAYCDEIATYSEDVFQMLKSRLRCEHSVCDATCNPVDPQNFIKKFLDSDADIFLQTSTIYDNPFLTKEFIENLEAEYRGTVFFDRNILGKWTAAEGVIYRQFADAISRENRSRFVVDMLPADAIGKTYVGLDFGGNGSFHAIVATRITSAGRVYVLASDRVDPAKSDADDLARWVYEFCETVYETWGPIERVYMDSAEQVLIRHCKKYTSSQRLSWLSSRMTNAKKSPIIDRIRLVSILMGGNRFFLLPTAQSAIDALCTARWKERGTSDERLDDGTTDIDSLDALEYSIERSMRALTTR